MFYSIAYRRTCNAVGPTWIIRVWTRNPKPEIRNSKPETRNPNNPNPLCCRSTHVLLDLLNQQKHRPARTSVTTGVTGLRHV
jgi:hypothetical protein